MCSDYSLSTNTFFLTSYLVTPLLAALHHKKWWASPSARQGWHPHHTAWLAPLQAEIYPAWNTSGHIRLGLSLLCQLNWVVLTSEWLLWCSHRKTQLLRQLNSGWLNAFAYFLSLPSEGDHTKPIFSASCIRNIPIDTSFSFQWPFLYFFFMKYQTHSQDY